MRRPTMSRALRTTITSAILMLYVSSSLLAQSQTTGRIAGSVSDQTGAVIEAADVTATDLRTGESRTAKTNTEGDYVSSGAIVSPGGFGRIFSTSSNPRLVQLALKLSW